MSKTQPNAKVFDAIEMDVNRLYDAASKNMHDLVSGQFSGSRIYGTESWRQARTIYVKVTGVDEDKMRIKEEYGSRMATRYCGIVQDGRMYTVRDRFARYMPLVRLSMVVGGQAQLELNAGFSTPTADAKYANYLPSGQMGHDIATTLNGRNAHPEAVIGLFNNYTNAITAVMLGAAVAEAFDGLILPEHRLASAEDFIPDYVSVQGLLSE